MKERVLLTGAAGLVGGRLAVLLADRFEVWAGRHLAAPPPGLPQVPLDLGSFDSLARALDLVRPAAVVHAAALADVDRCERDPRSSHALNVAASERLAGLCRERAARLIAFSTDLVLAGDRASSDESVEPRPILEYGRGKRAMESAVLAASPDFSVLRVALVLGRGFGPRATASEGVLWALAAGRRPRLFTDQHRTPIDPESLADLVARLIEGRGAGLFHAGGDERVSRHELGRRVAAAFGFDAGAVVAALQAAEPVGCPRPADCSMDSSRAGRELGWQPRPLAAAIRDSRPSTPEFP